MVPNVVCIFVLLEQMLVREKAKVPRRGEQWPQNWVELRPPPHSKHPEKHACLEKAFGAKCRDDIKVATQKLERVISGDQVWGDDLEQHRHLCAAVRSNVSCGSSRKKFHRNTFRNVMNDPTMKSTAVTVLHFVAKCAVRLRAGIKASLTERMFLLQEDKVIGE